MALMTSDGKYSVNLLAEIFAPPEIESVVMNTHGRGTDRPVLLWRGEIVYGRDTYEASLRAGVDQVFEELPDTGFPFERVIEEVHDLGHMNGSQRSLAAYSFWRLSSSGWVDLGLPDDETAHPPRYSKKQVATIFDVSVRSMNHAGKVVGPDSQAIPELRLAVEQGTLAVSDAAKVAGHPRAAQLKALELVQSGSVHTITSAAEKAPQEIEGGGRDDQELEGEADLDSPGQLSVGVALENIGVELIHSPLGGLHRLVEAEYVDAIVTNPAITESGLATLPDLVAFAAHALKPLGLLAVLSNPEYLPQFFDGLKNSDLLWVGSTVVIFPKVWRTTQGRHPMSLRCRLLLLFGKCQSLPHAGGDIIGVPGLKHLPHATHDLERAMHAIVKRYTQAGEVVCDPDMQGDAAVAQAAVALGRNFIGADREQSFIEILSRRLATTELGSAAPEWGTDVQGMLPFTDT